MQVTHDTYTAANGNQVVVVKETGFTIDSAQLFLEIMMNLPAERIILFKQNIHADFFELKTGLAGEMLQKVVNYSRRLGIVGDFSIYKSKSLRDFIFESNKSNNVVFVGTLDEAIKKLSS